MVVYHIKGCLNCRDCREGYMISCQTKKHRGGGMDSLDFTAQLASAHAEARLVGTAHAPCKSMKLP